MARSSRSVLLSVVAVIAVALLIIGGYALDRALHQGKVLRNVSVGDADLSGLGPAAAERAVLALEDELAVQPVAVDVADESFRIHPDAIGFRLDTAELAEQAMRVGRQGSIIEQFRWWLSHLFRDEVIPPTGQVSRERLEPVYDSWDENVVGDPPFNGAVRLAGTEPAARYPRKGRGVDRDQLTTDLVDQLVLTDRQPVVARVIDIKPTVTRRDVNRAVVVAEALLGGPVVLYREDPYAEVRFEVEDLTEAFSNRIVGGDDPTIEVGFEPEEVAARLEGLRSELELPPLDARFIVNPDETVSIEPGRAGTVIDPEGAADALRAAALRGSRSGELPFGKGADPEVTTEELEALGIEHLVSKFTTYHACCEPRVDNIHLIADEVDGAIVPVNGEFWLNDYVGERSAEEGYQEAPAIIGGVVVDDNLGGGISQFSTTLYNAVFWGGFVDVTHTPHSFWFSRYPQGVEATLSWPTPDLAFENDGECGVLVRTEYTDTSITVRLYGCNGGRSLVGEHVPGNRTADVFVASEGNGDSKVVEATTGEPYAFTDPVTTVYEGNSGLLPGEELKVSDGTQGFSVDVVRTITLPDGTEREAKWTWRYRPQPIVVERHPCQLPPESEDYTGEPCPAPPTTTTAPPETTQPPDSTQPPPDTTQPPPDTTQPPGTSPPTTGP
jgi:vancomycin resistance protein YoaR